MLNTTYTVLSNECLAPDIFRMRLRGDTSPITAPGQFVNLRIDGLYLRRPISVCDAEGDVLTLIYKVVGAGTGKLSELRKGVVLDALSGLGNGFDITSSGRRPCLIGGGVGVPPMFLLAKRLIEAGQTPTIALGFNTASEVFYVQEFLDVGCEVRLATADGSAGERGFVTAVLPEAPSHYFACGPEPMLRAVYHALRCSGQLSFEARMGCGFGACMGCTCRTITGYKRICREGPVLRKEEILWEA
ncbi:MAG: dihydroorotate dehydrogenase electron transfer subunit [Clostridia bacterium]|nr:dihydroorotate dehydrogenase electron transfer subunit [Clostridia bacterium]